MGVLSGFAAFGYSQTTTIYSDKTAWASVAAVQTTIDFSGLAPGGGVADYSVGGLTLAGATFLGITSFSGLDSLLVVDPLYNSALYDWGSGATLRGPATSVFGGGSNLRIEFPPNGVTSLGLDLMTTEPFADIVQIFLSTGEVFHLNTQTYPNRTFVGLIAKSPINFINFMPQSAYPIIDNLAFGALTVEINIRPYSFPNFVNPLAAKEVLPVAVLTNDSFDATAIDAARVRFGVTGTEAPPTGVTRKDVNRDGRLDLVFYFRTRETRIRCGDISAVLTGETLTGQVFRGVDSVKTIGCK